MLFRLVELDRLSNGSLCLFLALTCRGQLVDFGQVSLHSFLLKLIVNLTVEFDEALWGTFLTVATELEFYAQMLAFVAQVVDGEGIVLEVAILVVGDVVGELSYSVRRVDFMEDNAAVFFIFDVDG